MVEGAQIGAYRIIRQIGDGGMGSVWLAEHTMLGRRAAIKVLHPAYSSQPSIVTRFFNEARAATAISDPGIVQIFDFGTHTDGSAYIVMELLDGEGLDRRLQRLGVLSVQDALRIMRQVASSLGAAHARGIVHRDLKPENIFLVRDPEVIGGERAKILDFGIAKLVGDQTVKTQTSAVMGTPTFMSPEQCRGAGLVDQRSDVYSAGCVLFMLLAGRPPFDADGIGEIIAMHLREPAPPPSSRAHGIPPEVDQLVLRCLAKDPAHRFASGTELANAIGELLGMYPTGTVRAPSVVGSGRATASAPTTLSGAAGVTSTFAAGSRRKWLAATGVAVVALGGGVTWLATRDSGSRASASRMGVADNSSMQAQPSHVPSTQPQSPQVPATQPPQVPATHPPQVPATQPPQVPSTSAPTDVASARPDPNATITAAMAGALQRFKDWATAHAGQPCPEMAAITNEMDPWGRAYVLTCTDQPADQIVGMISRGPDGALGTDDDVASWTLGRELTMLARGARWKVASSTTSDHAKRPAASAVKPAKTKSHATTKPAGATSATKAGPVDTDGDGIPDSR